MKRLPASNPFVVERINRVDRSATALTGAMDTTMPSASPGKDFTTELVEPRSIEQRYSPLAIPSPTLFTEARKARERITRKAGPCAVLVVLPVEMPVDPPSTNVDFFREESQKRSIIALAVVAESAAVNAATKFYFRYHAQSFEAKVFTEETEAKAWLKEKLDSAVAAIGAR